MPGGLARNERGDGKAEVFHRQSRFERIRPAHEAFGVSKGEPEDHEVCPKSLVCRGDLLETSEAIVSASEGACWVLL